MTPTPKTNEPAALAGEQSRLAFREDELLAVRLLPAEFARAVGVSKQTVSRWIHADKVTLGADGRLNPTMAMRQLLRTGDPGRVRARLLRQAFAGMADLRAEAGRAAALEQDLAAAQERSGYLDGFARELDLAAQFAPDVMVREIDQIRAAGHDKAALRALFADLLERALITVGVALDTLGGDAPTPADLSTYYAAEVWDIRPGVLSEPGGAGQRHFLTTTWSPTMTSKPLPPPVGICRDCAHNITNTFMHYSGVVMVSYCDHNRTAGILLLAVDPPAWTLYTPIEREAWFDSINAAAIESLPAVNSHAS